MRRVLVTGPGGFLGQHALLALAEAGYEIHAVDLQLVHRLGVVSHVADLLAGDQIAALLERVRPTHLLHLAWYVEHKKFWSALENGQWVEASLRLLRHFAASGGQRCVTAGSCAEYEWGHAVCREAETPCRPATLYGAAKHGLQLIQTAFCREAGLTSAWGRIFYLYGPHEHPARFVPSVIRALLRGEPALCSHGSQVRDFLHVEDVARAFVALLDSGVEGPVNIGSGVPVTQREVVEAIGRITARADLIRLGALPSPAGEPERLLPDVSSLRSTGFVPRYTLESGLSQAVSWWREQLTAAGS